MEKYDFGPAAQYLFRPCELDDDFFEQVCAIVTLFEFVLDETGPQYIHLSSF